MFWFLPIHQAVDAEKSWSVTFGSHRKGRLSVERGGTETSAHLNLTVSNGSTTRKSTLVQSDDKWAEYKLAIPMRVNGDSSPQILAKLYRSNWLDFEIIALRGLKGKREFSFSCRDEMAIKWNASNGKLVSFETFDRWEPRPKSLAAKERNGLRWELCTWYHFEARRHKWTAFQRKWESYRFGNSPDGQEIQKVKDCPFAWPISAPSLPLTHPK